MTHEELAAACRNAITERARMRAEMGDPGTGYPWNGPAQLTLVLKRKTPVLGRTVRLFGRAGGPAGEFIAETGESEVLAAFGAQEILDWLAARGLVASAPESP